MLGDVCSPLQTTCMNSKKWIQAGSKDRNPEYTPVPGDPQWQTISIINQFLWTAVTTLATSASALKVKPMCHYGWNGGHSGKYGYLAFMEATEEMYVNLRNWFSCFMKVRKCCRAQSHWFLFWANSVYLIDRLAFLPRPVLLFNIDPWQTALTAGIKHAGILKRQHDAVRQRPLHRHGHSGWNRGLIAGQVGCS